MLTKNQVKDKFNNLITYHLIRLMQLLYILKIYNVLKKILIAKNFFSNIFVIFLIIYEINKAKE